MKRNLWILLGVIVLVAVTARLGRNSGPNAEWQALESDLRIGFERLWQRPGQRVEVVERDGGPVAQLHLDLDAESPTNWCFPLLRLIARRHPNVHLGAARVVAGAELTEGADGGAFGPTPELQRRAELLRRQAQAVSDGLMGKGESLVLLKVQEAQPQLDLYRNTYEPDREKRANSEDGAYSGAARFVSRQGAPPILQVSGCLVVIGEPPAPLLSRVSGVLPGANLRLVKLDRL